MIMIQLHLLRCYRLICPLCVYVDQQQQVKSGLVNITAFFNSNHRRIHTHTEHLHHELVMMLFHFYIVRVRLNVETIESLRDHIILEVYCVLENNRNYALLDRAEERKEKMWNKMQLYTFHNIFIKLCSWWMVRYANERTIEKAELKSAENIPLILFSDLFRCALTVWSYAFDTGSLWAFCEPTICVYI